MCVCVCLCVCVVQRGLSWVRYARPANNEENMHSHQIIRAHICQTYGEFTSATISDFVRRVNIKPDETFIDLGSGAFRLEIMFCAETHYSCPHSFTRSSTHDPARRGPGGAAGGGRGGVCVLLWD